MLYQIDDRLAAFSANLWKPVKSAVDSSVTPSQISIDGLLYQLSTPSQEPETHAERFQTINWRCRRRSRWFTENEYSSLVQISVDGRLIGDIGFHYFAES